MADVRLEKSEERLEKKLKVVLNESSRKDDSSELGYVIDPIHGKLQILEIGDAGDGGNAFLVKGKQFGPDWREKSELVTIHLTEAGRKRARHIGKVCL